jgi:hypothetical protein
MTETFFPAPETPMSLSAFIDTVEASGIIPKLKASQYDRADMARVAGWLAALALDRSVLRDPLVQGLGDFRNFQADNDFKPSTVMIERRDGYSIRAVIWYPPGPLYPPEIFSYFETHDHNFDFFTAGCLGPGYRTRLYHYDYDAVEGFPGERVDLTSAGDTGLPPGKVMYYYGSRDIHTQYPPEALSVSLNLLLPKTEPAHRRQYEMTLEETEDGTAGRLIAGRIDRTAQERALFETVVALGAEKNIRLVRDIARTHASATVRAVAWESLIDGGAGDAGDLAAAEADRDPHVRAVAMRWRSAAE